MQHLLDFIQEHTLDDQLYLVAESPAGELEALWRRGQAGGQWQIRAKGGDAPWELVAASELMRTLEERGADMLGLKRELHSMLATLIAFADTILRDAHEHLGSQLVQRFVSGHQSFIQQLQAAVEQLIVHPKPSMEVVAGGGAQTTLRSGHLSLVR